MRHNIIAYLRHALLLIVLSTQVTIASELFTGPYIAPMLHYTDTTQQTELHHGFGPGLGIGYQLDPFWGVELAWHQYASDTTKNNEKAALESFDSNYFHVDGYYYTQDIDQNRWAPYFVFGLGSRDVSYDNGESDNGFDANIGLGFRRMLSDRWVWRSDLRMLISENNSGAGVMLNTGLLYSFGKPHKVAAKFTPTEKTQKEFVFIAEKPEEKPPAAVVSKDSDNDGVVDDDDQCPDTAVGIKVDDKGCEADDDFDGIKNSQDQCPNTSAGAKVDEHGCYIVFTDTKTFSLDVKFDSGKSTLQDGSIASIEKLAVFLTEYPQTFATIEGHSDSVGSAEYNKALSQRRAEAIRETLIQRFNIDAERVTAVGYGEERPIADNETAEGRAKNRRVVVNVEADVKKVYK